MTWLDTYGWNAHFEQAFSSFRTSGLEPARIIEEQRGMYRLITEDGEARAEIAGRLRQGGEGDQPAVGDWVAIRIEPGGGRSVIQQVLERQSKISRRSAGRTMREQVLAANLDTVFMVTSCNEDFNPRRIERYLTMICESGASPVVLLNKADLSQDARALVRLAESVTLDVPVLGLSAKFDGDLETLSPYLRTGKTVALLGSSGVGKSTILNRLLGREEQAVQEVREEDARGRHTTRSRQLFLLPGGGLVIDTPGLREVALWVSGSGLGQAFADIEDLASQCKFQNCNHSSEPDCAIRSAVENGTLAAERLESYYKLRKELEHLERRTDPAAQSKEKQRRKTIHKNLRAGHKKGKSR